jgi:nitrite reductase (NO-forming)
MKRTVIFILLVITGLIGASLTFNTDMLQEPLKDSITRGQAVFSSRCMSCHQANGTGLPGVYPPLANSDHLKTDSTNLINIILNGQNEKYSVNGREYSIPMSDYAYLSDREIADVLNYIGNNWGNAFKPITEDQVKNQRNK